MKHGGTNSPPIISSILKYQFSRINCMCAMRGFFFASSMCPLQKVGILNQIINIHTKESLTQATYYSGHGVLLGSLSSRNLPPLFSNTVPLAPFSPGVWILLFLPDKHAALSSLGKCENKNARFVLCFEKNKKINKITKKPRTLAPCPAAENVILALQ